MLIRIFQQPINSVYLANKLHEQKT